MAEEEPLDADWPKRTIDPTKAFVPDSSQTETATVFMWVMGVVEFANSVGQPTSSDHAFRLFVTKGNYNIEWRPLRDSGEWIRGSGPTLATLLTLIVPKCLMWLDGQQANATTAREKTAAKLREETEVVNRIDLLLKQRPF